MSRKVVPVLRVALVAFSLSLASISMPVKVEAQVSGEAAQSFIYSPNGPVPVGSSVTISLTQAADTVDWDMGDGTLYPAVVSSITHTYRRPGNYSVVAKGRSAGGVSVKVGSVLVYQPSLSLPQSSSTIVTLPEERLVWSVNQDNDSVTAVNADTLTRTAEIQVGGHPTSIAADKDGRVWVTCRDDDTVWVLSGTNGALLQKIQLPYGTLPVSIVIDKGRSVAYIAARGSKKLIQLSTPRGDITKSLQLSASPEALALSGDGTSLYVSQLISSPQAGVVWSIGTSDLTLRNAIQLAVDTTTLDGSNSAKGVPNYLLGLALHPSSNELWVTAKKDNIVSGMVRTSTDIGPETTLRTLITRIDTTRAQEVTSKRLDIDNKGLPGAITIGEKGNHVLVTLLTNNELVILDPYTNIQVGTIDTALAPDGVALDSKTGRIFVKSLTERMLTVVDGSQIFARGQGQVPILGQVSLIAQEKRMTNAEVLGKQLFYDSSSTKMAFEGYISCASCHIDGGHDGQVWDFTGRGEGLRNTTTLRGQEGDKHGPLHWTGNFDEVQDFEHDIRGPFGGRGFLTDAQFEQGRNTPLGGKKAGVSPELDALAAYVNSLDRFDRSPFKKEDGSFTNEAMQGTKLFLALNCSSCHSGVMLSDSASRVRHDVGTAKGTSGKRLGSTLDGFDTPTLIGLAHTAPYLHDGSAKTLDELFSKGSGVHTLSHLPKVLIDRLTRFLLEVDEKALNLEELGKKAGLLDSDGDSIDDAWEITYFKQLGKGTGDHDGDGVSDLDEFRRGTDPTVPASPQDNSCPRHAGTLSHLRPLTEGLLQASAISGYLKSVLEGGPIDPSRPAGATASSLSSLFTTIEGHAKKLRLSVADRLLIGPSRFATASRNAHRLITLSGSRARSIAGATKIIADVGSKRASRYLRRVTSQCTAQRR